MIRITKLLFFKQFLSLLVVLVSSVVTILSILSQKLLWMLQTYVRARARARREEVVEMTNANNEE